MYSVPRGDDEGTNLVSPSDLSLYQNEELVNNYGSVRVDDDNSSGKIQRS